MKTRVSIGMDNFFVLRKFRNFVHSLGYNKRTNIRI